MVGGGVGVIEGIRLGTGVGKWEGAGVGALDGKNDGFNDGAGEGRALRGANLRRGGLDKGGGRERVIQAKFRQIAARACSACRVAGALAPGCSWQPCTAHLHSGGGLEAHAHEHLLQFGAVGAHAEELQPRQGLVQ